MSTDTEAISASVNKKNDNYHDSIKKSHKLVMKHDGLENNLVCLISKCLWSRQDMFGLLLQNILASSYRYVLWSVEAAETIRII